MCCIKFYFSFSVMYSTYDHKNALETEKVFDTTYAETRLKQFSGLRLLFHVTANV